jgi:hypothetical protein
MGHILQTLPSKLSDDPLVNLIYLIPLGALLGILISLSHSSGNIWLRQRNYMMLSTILPVVALVITVSISSNIFLSLGMIGALSIIRYRTPIKSPYELALLFSFITVGISLGVDIRYACFLTLFLISIPFLFNLLDRFAVNRSMGTIIKKGGGAMHHIDGEGSVELIIQGEGIEPEELNIPENALSTISNTLSENNKNQLVVTLLFSELKTANSFRRKIESHKNITYISMRVL